MPLRPILHRIGKWYWEVGFGSWGFGAGIGKWDWEVGLGGVDLEVGLGAGDWEVGSGSGIGKWDWLLGIGSWGLGAGDWGVVLAKINRRYLHRYLDMVSTYAPYLWSTIMVRSGIGTWVQEV